jgi:sterol desaturase/sphingolipid hydroxylase (fatty acid hydroxylase superfamily)
MQLYGDGFIAALVQVSLVYYLSCFMLHDVTPKIFPVKTVYRPGERKDEAREDALRSFGALSVKAGVLWLVEELQDRGYTQLYTGPVATYEGWAYLLFTIMVLDYLHDTWFYWTHYLLHWRPLYKYVHYMHHRPRAPTAYTGYAFHPVEGAVVFANEIIVTLLFPIHASLHRWYHLFTTIIHTGGHCGYEIAPFIPTLVGMFNLVLRGEKNRWLNTVQHHDLHHSFPGRHFSLYFTHWDRWMGTMHESYDALVGHPHRVADKSNPRPPVTPAAPAVVATSRRSSRRKTHHS